MVVLSEVKNMFWGVTLDGGKHYTQTVERSFHISMAALEPSTDGKPSKQPVSVMIQHDKAEFMLCTLEQGRVYQQTLDLNFTEGEEVTFFLNGTGIVHLTGYLIEDENMMSDMDDMDDISMEDMSDSESDTAPALVGPDDDDSDDDDDDDDSPVLTVSAKKRKQEQKEKPGKKKAKVVVVEQGDDEDSDDDDSDDDDDMPFALEDFDDEDDDDDDDDEDDDDELNEEIVKQIKAKKVQPASTPKSGKKSATTTPKSEVKATPQQKPDKTQNGSETTESKKKKKKKNKDDKEKTPAGPGGDAKKDKTPKKTVLAGGTISEEIKVGHGPEAKKGKMVHVYYKGTLGKTGKQFDSCTSGKPFKFRLGKKEVISGWDSGVQGMKVGGTRKLTVPPQQGYGNQRTGPIPPNSTLVFEVELKAVS
ncbi:46 kDa FK506-binding nuclear protein-like isoform X2 [Argopecten irradians]|uniref:46 kDa FK506-binding nuclear protein-like isoform X2 n=1 Tax=Argopecten irradians TaxID=31199 RepID=UPI00372336D1